MPETKVVAACVLSGVVGAAIATIALSSSTRRSSSRPTLTDEEIFAARANGGGRRDKRRGGSTNSDSTSSSGGGGGGEGAGDEDQTQRKQQLQQLQQLQQQQHQQQFAELPPDIEAEVFSRNVSFFGEEGFRLIRGSFMVVVGLGGVGSHAAHMIARSGVGHLRIVDFDQVTLSSLNRHAVATLADVGRPKSEVLREKLLSVVPWCDIDARKQMFTADAAESLLEPLLEPSSSSSSSSSSSFSSSSSSSSSSPPRLPDVVVDCIDDVNTKADLICYCQARGIPVVTACAAGGKADPTRLHMGSLNDASRDPLATKMRWKL
jgi:tRNA A37 threonylcarbamoyladenosine dehydratase